VRRRTGEAVPPELLIFDGRELTTAVEWTEAFERWADRRDQWEVDHGVVLPEKQVLSSCPFDGMSMIGLPHAGGWSRCKRPDGEDETRCGEHNLTPDQHGQ
jgi:hypothetical protein